MQPPHDYRSDLRGAQERAELERDQFAGALARAAVEPPRILLVLKILVGVISVIAIAIPMLAQALAPTLGLENHGFLPMEAQVAIGAVVAGSVIAFAILIAIGSRYPQRSGPRGGYPAQRAAMVGVNRFSAARRMPYIVIGSWIFLLLLPAIGATVSLFTGQEMFAHSDGGAGPALTLWLFIALLVGAMVIVHQRRRILRERTAAVLAHATAPFAHRRIESVAELAAWLDTHWRGPTSPFEMSEGPCFCGAALVIEHFMAAVVMSPLAFARHYPGYATVHLAAWFPHAPDGRVAFAEQQALASLGFQLSVEPAGLRAVANQRVARDLVGGSRGGEILAAVLARLVATAKALGAVPLPS